MPSSMKRCGTTTSCSMPVRFATKRRLPYSMAMLGIPPLAFRSKSAANPSSAITKTPTTSMSMTSKPSGPTSISAAAKTEIWSFSTSSEKAPESRANWVLVPGRLTISLPWTLMSTSPAPIVTGSKSRFSERNSIVFSSSVVLMTRRASASKSTPIACKKGASTSSQKAAANPALVISK